MKLKESYSILKDSGHWMFLAILSNGFFILMAWIAYPESFSILVTVMFAFSMLILILGMFLTKKNKIKQDEAFFSFLKDVSEENEERLIEVSGELHKEKIHILGEELRCSKEKVEETQLNAKAYEEFIESWVHEIKKPMALGTLILGNRKDEMSPFVHQRLDYAMMNIREQVEQILFYARLQTSHVDYRLERILLSECYEDVLLDMKPILSEKNITIISYIEDVPIVSDKKTLQFIFSQIFTNAVKYSKDDVEPWIRLKTGFDEGKNRYYTSIEDNGIGVMVSDLPFIFDKGFTGENYKESHSTGIGLYLVKKLCDEINIDIEVASKVGEGFSIKLLFPVV